MAQAAGRLLWVPSFVNAFGRELGVIPSSVFSMLVIMALLTTVMTMPLLRRLMPGTELARGGG